MPEGSDSERESDTGRAAFLRDIAEDVRGDSSESEQLAAILYRVSDLYDADEETTVPEIYRNVQNILEIKERGGLPERDG
ncbi:hypothetical protein [Natronomonas gomsonensis]|uniref:hypothetical protein n=1 Tax=Natronomonas gomsonensis TaxID=1046043 RepID=UPI0015BEF8EA|nr:hypothetical protein [Natronomonas gomsonensis]